MFGIDWDGDGDVDEKDDMIDLFILDTEDCISIELHDLVIPIIFKICLHFNLDLLNSHTSSKFDKTAASLITYKHGFKFVITCKLNLFLRYICE